MISSTVQEAGRTVWPPPPIANHPAPHNEQAPAPPVPPDSHLIRSTSRAARLIAPGATPLKIIGGLLALVAIGVIIVIGPRALTRRSRSASVPADETPIEMPTSTKTTPGGATRSKDTENEEPGVRAPEIEAVRLAAINTAREFSLPTGRTLGQTLETMAPPTGNLPPWMAELLTNGRYVVTFFARGAPGTPTVAFEFEVDPGAGTVIGRNSAAKSVLLGTPPKPPVAKVKPPVKVKNKRRPATKKATQPVPDQEESLDSLLGSVGVPTEQVNLEAERSAADPVKVAPQSKPAKHSAAKRAAKAAAKTPTPPPSPAPKKGSDEALLDDLLKE